MHYCTSLLVIHLKCIFLAGLLHSVESQENCENDITMTQSDPTVHHATLFCKISLRGSCLWTFLILDLNK